MKNSIGFRSGGSASFEAFLELKSPFIVGILYFKKNQDLAQYHEVWNSLQQKNLKIVYVEIMHHYP